MLLSISEALAEIKLIEKKISKKRENIACHCIKMDHMPDPFEKERGGSQGFLKSEMQSCEDLLERHIKIRNLISKANLENEVTVEGVTKNITSWLIFKREILSAQLSHLQSLKSTIERKLADAAARPQLYKKADETEAYLIKVSSNIDLNSLQKKIEDIITIQERLDGVLSMKNAQIQIDL